MDNVVVSFVIPVFNNERFLPACLDSVLSQTFRQIEVICVNDCSNDHSVRILKDFKAKDKRIRLINFRENMGPGEARNKGISEAKGRYLRMVDADDFLPLDSTELLLNTAKRYQNDVVRGKFQICNINGQGKIDGWGCPKKIIPNASVKSERLLWRLDQHWAYLFNTDFLRAKGVHYDTTMRNGQDAAFIANLLPCLNRVTLLDKTVYYYRYNPHSTTNRKRNKEFFINIFSLYEKVYKKFPDADLTETADYIFYDALCSYLPGSVFPTVLSDLKKKEAIGVLEYLQKIIVSHNSLKLCMENNYNWQSDMKMSSEMKSIILLLHNDFIEESYDIIKDIEQRKTRELEKEIKIDQLEMELNSVYTSSSWKISAPLRQIKRLLKSYS